jgi:hypothetical protein
MTNSTFLPAAAALLGGLIMPVYGQVTCTAATPLGPVQARSEGNTELVGDILVTCTGGLSTLPGLPVPQVNITVFLNTNVTSKVTSSSVYNEALLLVDEPNSPVASVTHPLLNCGQTGAPDNGVSGPGICQIISTGVPVQTYDGTPNVGPSGLCDVYGCGRPNAFQGRISTTGDNVVEFLGVPFDPGVPRTFRITNLRANANALGSSPTPINAEVSITGSSSIIFVATGTSISAPITLGFAEIGFVAKIPSSGVVRVAEGFGASFKPRNVSYTLANSSFVPPFYFYASPAMNAPVEAAQNVPGVFYYAEDGFQWQNNFINKPPAPDPPQGFANLFTGGLFTFMTNYPLNSVGYGGVNTGIGGDGVAEAGTRVALTFVAFGETVSFPPFVYLHPMGSPSTTSGVMVLTSADPEGAGPFTPGASTTIHNLGTAVYEVLYADPFLVEYADIPCAVSGPLHAAVVEASLAPFYAGANFATPTVAHPTPTAVPRFSRANRTLLFLF